VVTKIAAYLALLRAANHKKSRRASGCETLKLGTKVAQTSAITFFTANMELVSTQNLMPTLNV